MSPLNRLARTNPLIQRVQRHAGLATLFHAPGRERALAPGRPVYAPALPALPPHPPADLPSTPPDFPVEISVQPAPTQAAQPQFALTAQPATAAHPVAPAAPAPSAPLAHPTADLTHPEPEANETAELNWPLLQAIMQKHEQRQAEAQATEATAHPTSTRQAPPRPETSSIEDASPQPQQPRPTTLIDPVVQPGSRLHPDRLIAALPTSTSATGPTPEAHPSISASAVPPTPAEGLAPAHLTDQTQGAAGTPLAPPAPAAGQPTNSARGSLATTQPAPANLATPPTGSPTSKPLPAQANAAPPAEHAPHAQGEALAETVQPFPLESAWPVEQIAPVSTSPAAQTQPAVQLPGAPAPAPVPQPPALAEPIRRALQSVTPGRASDSSVELITPRQPRPVAPKLGETQRTQSAADESETQAAPAAAEAVSFTPTPVPLLPPAQPGLVQTEIGPLPADLWTLIGQPIPAQQKPAQTRPAQFTNEVPVAPPEHISRADQPPASSPTSPTPRAEPLPAFSNNPSGIQTGRASEPPASQPHAAAPAPISIQRSVVVEEMSVEPAAEQTGPAAESAATDQPAPAGAGASQLPAQAPAPGAALDLDELARQVYAELRNRLQIDWERIRRKF